MNTYKFTIVSSVFESPDKETLSAKLEALKETNARIVLYASPECYEVIEHCCTDNILLMPPVDIQSLWIYQQYEKYKPDLPTNRNWEKDTETYILFRHAKHECITNAIQVNPWKTTHFIWADFDIFYRCSDRKSIQNYFEWLNHCDWRDRFFTMTGGWDALTNIADVLNAPFWRFCGVFTGDSQSILEFCELYKIQFPLFLEKYRKWVWEFNIWAWMEHICGNQWKASWNRESPDINELFMSSCDYFTKPIIANAKIDYNHYKIENYFASSSSYICYKGEHYLNTRYVNYWITPNGSYLYYDGSHQIKNKNVLSKWNYITKSPEDYREIDEQISMPHPLYETPISIGLEDIRLYEYSGNIHYVATTIGYTSNGRPRIITGEYNIETASIHQGTIIEPPVDTYCEKNWIPIVGNDNELFFIYSWHPMQIGKIVEENNGGRKRLEIVQKYEVESLIFRKIRGSSPFVETERGRLGVVHYSEEHSPRHYYHLLVLLDKHSFRVIEYSNTFCFEKLGIEFCMGFAIHKKEYVFWISRHDRNPCVIAASPDAFVFSSIQ